MAELTASQHLAVHERLQPHPRADLMLLVADLPLLLTALNQYNPQSLMAIGLLDWIASLTA